MTYSVKPEASNSEKRTSATMEKGGMCWNSRGRTGSRRKASDTGGGWVTNARGNCTCNYATYTFHAGIRFRVLTARYVALAYAATFPTGWSFAPLAITEQILFSSISKPSCLN